MSYFIKLLATLVLAALIPVNARAIEPQHAFTVQTKVTIAVTNTFQLAATGNTLRTGCTIQYLGTTAGYIFFGGAVAPADTTTSFQLLTKGQTFTCAAGPLGIAVDAIWVTGTSTDVFIVAVQ